MKALFVLLPAGRTIDDLLAAAPTGMHAGVQRLRCRRYPPADGTRHLLSLLRDGRDPAATQWLRGTVLAVLGGGVLGAIVNGVLAHGFGMLGGLLEIALPLGAMVGAFLGGFTAAMTGTQVARDELKLLAGHVHPGDVLLQWTGDPAVLAALDAHCRAAGLVVAPVD